MFFIRANAEVKSYFNKADYVDLPCDYCRGTDFDVLSQKDRYRLKVKTVVCKNCGLIFINPRMSDGCYDGFYKTGLYRRLLDSYKHKRASDEGNELKNEFDRGRKFGLYLADELGSYLDGGLTIETGSSCGGVLSGLKEKLPRLDVLGIEPSEAEASFANAGGVKTLNRISDLDAENLLPASNLLVVRSLNHLTSPREFFIWAHKHLKQNGKLVVVVIDFANFCKRRSKILIQVDHPFMFTPAVLKNFIESAGFQTVSEYFSPASDYIKLVAIKKDTQPFLSIKMGKTDYLDVKNSLKMPRLTFRDIFKKVFS